MKVIKIISIINQGGEYSILCPVALIILCTYYKMVITWYYIFASFIAAFVVYLVATGGWEKVKSIWDRTKYKDSEGE